MCVKASWNCVQHMHGNGNICWGIFVPGSYSGVDLSLATDLKLVVCLNNETAGDVQRCTAAASSWCVEGNKSWEFTFEAHAQLTCSVCQTIYFNILIIFWANREHCLPNMRITEPAHENKQLPITLMAAVNVDERRQRRLNVHKLRILI